MYQVTLSTVAAREQENAELRWMFAKTMIEPNIKEASNDETAESFLPNHEFLIRSYAPAIAIVKSRKVAHSWGIAAKCFCRAATEAKSTSIIASYDEDEAREKLNFLLWIYRAVCDKHPAMLRELKMSEGTEVRTFANGSRIRFIARKAPTGPGASIELDEFSVEPPGRVTAAEILVGALGCTTHTGQVSIGGTQRGPDTIFNQIVSGEIEEKMKNDPLYQGMPLRTWSVKEFPWWTSPALSLDPFNAAIMCPDMATEDRVREFANDKLINQFALYTSTPELGMDLFQREFECKVLDDKLSYYEWALIKACYELGGPNYYFTHCEVDGKKWGKGPASEDPFRLAKVLINQLAAKWKSGEFRGELGLSMDVGRDRDNDEIFIGQVPRSDKEMLLPRLNIGMQNMPFDGKEHILHYLYERLPITRGLLDSTRGSMGVQLGERMNRKYHQRAMPFEFTLASKQVLASGLKSRMENQKIVLPRKTTDYPALEQQITRVKKTLTNSGNVVFELQRTSKDHGDKFWSLCMLSELFAHAKKWRPIVGASMRQNSR